MRPKYIQCSIRFFLCSLAIVWEYYCTTQTNAHRHTSTLLFILSYPSPLQRNSSRSVSFALFSSTSVHVFHLSLILSFYSLLSSVTQTFVSSLFIGKYFIFLQHSQSFALTLTYPLESCITHTNKHTCTEDDEEVLSGLNRKRRTEKTLNEKRNLYETINNVTRRADEKVCLTFTSRRFRLVILSINSRDNLKH